MGVDPDEAGHSTVDINDKSCFRRKGPLADNQRAFD